MLRVDTVFFVIPIIFYIVVAAARLDLGVLRRAGWLFDMGNSADRSWYEFYTYFGEFSRYL
jgi:SulP family sulfate permease